MEISKQRQRKKKASEREDDGRLTVSLGAADMP